ncbi:MAG: hypothetical protein GY880_08375 [Planctomycetaceae bacterium]|nr:hypothetical protein [Planctomycetaceae bacterium]MCP4477525.1 hypothetical protein [Planctomycetaceae bacterium]MCP4774238.1 hypothetical protein [Planctomycetaceae bacterium]
MNSHNSLLRGWYLVIALMLVLNAGCSQEPQADQFTHLWSSNGTHVWTHLGVELIQTKAEVFQPPEFFLNRELLPDEKVKLAGGVVIHSDGDSLFVDNRVVTETNVLIENDGRVIPNAYIKTDY